MTTEATTTVAALQAWAAGSYPAMAAVELLNRAFGGRFATRGHPWIGDDDGRARLEPTALRSGSALSGGERRVLRLVAALVDAEPLDIVDVVTGLDRAHLDLVLAALAHAGGSHEHAALTLDRDGTVHLSQPGPLHRWPTDGASGPGGAEEVAAGDAYLLEKAADDGSTGPGVEVER